MLITLFSSEELKELAFFKDVNWDSFMEKKVPLDDCKTMWDEPS